MADNTNIAASSEPFTLYLYDVSYFSGKMEAFFRYKEIPYRRLALTASDGYRVLYRHTGVMKVPVVRSATGQWFKDTTPMIDWFDRAYPASTVMPEDPAVGFVSKLVEDYADEWLWRPAMYYRWWYDHRIMGPWLAREIFHDRRLPFWLKARFIAHRQRRLFLTGDGVTAQNRHRVEETFMQNLEGLQQVLADSPFLLGDRPTLVDFGYMGPMFRHFSIDPTPARIMRERAPKVYAWVARLWNATASGFDQQRPTADFSHPGWKRIIEDVCRVYLPYLYQNAQSWKDGHQRFDYDTADVCYPKLPVIRYRVWCREVLQRRYADLDVTARHRVEAILQYNGAITALLEGGIIDSKLHEYYTTLPLRKTDRRPGLLKGIALRLRGTPWDPWNIDEAVSNRR